MDIGTRLFHSATAILLLVVSGRRTCAAPAAMACSTASRRTDPAAATQHQAVSILSWKIRAGRLRWSPESVK